MFKCVECGLEYKTKPDYCDCGNDIFELIDDIQEVPEQVENTAFNTQKQEYNEPFSYSGNSYYAKNQQTKNYDPVSIIVFSICILIAFLTVFIIGNPKENPTANKPAETKPAQVTQNIPNVESYWDNSLPTVKQDNTLVAKTNEIEVIPTPTQTQPTQQPAQAVSKNTPAQKDPITEKFEKWLNQPSKYEQQPQRVSANTTTAPKTTAQKTQTTQSTTTQQTKKQVQNNNSQNDLLSRVQKQYNNTKTATTTTTQKPVSTTTTTTKPQTTTTTAKTTTTTPKTTTPTTTASSSGRKTDPMSSFFDNNKTSTTTAQTTQTTKPASQTTTQTVTTQKPVSTTTAKTTQTPRVVQTTPKRSTSEIQQELSNYKASLRNSIGRKVNFANVVGDGSCSITFTINSSGKLTNRNFSQKSSNITLNDAVYNAMISTPSFNPPPEGYKGETLTFYVKIYNGNFEISLR